MGVYLTGGDVDGYAQRVIASRVGTAHPSSRRPRHAVTDSALVEHTRALGWLLRCALLARLGVPLVQLHERLTEIGATHVHSESATET